MSEQITPTIPLSDSRWKTFKSAMGATSDQRPLIETFKNKPNWDDAFNFIVYQDSIGELSLAATPFIIDYIKTQKNLEWEPLTLMATIAVANPTDNEYPNDLIKIFNYSMNELPSIIISHQDKDWSDIVTASAVACIAASRGQLDLAKHYLEFESAELDRARELLDKS